MKNQGRKILIAGLALAAMFEASPAFSRESVVNTSSCLNLRTRASARSGVKACLPPGTKVQILGNHGRFSYVSVNGKKGYLFNNYLKKSPRSSSASSAPERPTVDRASTEGVSPAQVPESAGLPVTYPLNRPTASTENNMFNSGMMNQRDHSDSLTTTGGDAFRISRSDARVAQQEMMDQVSQKPAREISAPAARADASGNDLSALSWSVTQAITDKDIGRGNGYTLRSSVGWAKLNEDGSISIDNKRSHCTSATHAHFLKMVGELHKAGHIRLNSQSMEALNSSLFRDAWNSNGYGNGKLMELLGGQSFADRALAKRGDFMKMDRSNGTGHTTIFSHFEGNKVCYWSSNKATRGPGVQCESLSGKTLTFSRITDLQNLQAGLDNLHNELNGDRALADVRRRGGNGFVKKSALQLASASSLGAPPALGSYVAGIFGGRRQVANLDSGKQ